MLYSDAMEELREGFSAEPGWVSHPGPNDSLEWEHPSSGTMLRFFSSGAIVVMNGAVLSDGAACYQNQLRYSKSMGQWIRLGRALVARDDEILLGWYRPDQLR